MIRATMLIRVSLLLGVIAAPRRRQSSLPLKSLVPRAIT
jgi:hypothetical protein